MPVIGVNTGPSTGIMRASGTLGTISRLLDESLERVETGNKINRGSDDPTGLMKAVTLRGEIEAREEQFKINQEYVTDLDAADEAVSQGIEIVSEMHTLAINYETAVTQGNTSGQAAIVGQLNELAEALTEVMDNASVTGSDLGAGLNLNLTVDAELNQYNLQTQAANSANLPAGGAANVDAAIAALSGAAGDGTTLATNLENSLAELSEISSELMVTRDNVIYAANDVMTSQIDGRQKQYDLIMRTDEAEESSIVTQLQNRQQATISSISVQNGFDSNLVNLFA